MYSILLVAHSLLRWIVLLLILYAIAIAIRGYKSGRTFTSTDNALRHWTATAAHIQFMVGILLYFKSPIPGVYWKSIPVDDPVMMFFSWLHPALMTLAIIIITIGSGLAKRRMQDEQKFKTMMLWFIIGLLVMSLAIPWPFSPIAQRMIIRFP